MNRRIQHEVLDERRIRSRELIHADARASVPEDPALPGLVLLARRERLAAVLTPLLESRFGPGVHFEQTCLSVRRYVPGKRCIAKVELHLHETRGAPAKPYCILAKCYAGNRGETVYENCRELWRRGFLQGNLRVAEPLAYDPRWQSMFLSWESGRTVRDLLLAGEDAHLAMEGAALWLCKLHSCGFRGGRIYSYTRHFHTLGVWKENLSAIHAEMGVAFGSIRAQIMSQLAKHKKELRAPTHRDFSPEHLVVEGNCFTGLDFDEFCQYDVVFDVAHFMAHMRFLALTSFGALDYLDAHVARFEEAYSSESGEYSQARARLFTAVAYLKLAYLDAVVRRMTNGDRVVLALLQAAREFASC